MDRDDGRSWCNASPDAVVLPQQRFPKGKGRLFLRVRSMAERCAPGHGPGASGTASSRRLSDQLPRASDAIRPVLGRSLEIPRTLQMLEKNLGSKSVGEQKNVTKSSIYLLGESRDSRPRRRFSVGGNQKVIARGPELLPRKSS